ncbi:hypothetical protein H2509_08890 [Stappia sp. F7233]|uniref:Uncharacterized protein n=1 Tax=Stappia albiluteola TaxID=2758565 RepID=A0A839AEA4_9HYPH|nr:hypothetical protein [Stappia albiluteola]MBA5777242.1 hypothetical protein [Stappia albiluteola]
MYASLGFFIAGLLAIAVIPAIWRRAVRLTRKAVEATTPMTLSDTRAEISAIRAAHAVDYRRLEKVAEGLRAELTESRIARDRAASYAKTVASAQDIREDELRETLARNEEQARRIAELEAQVADFSDQVRELEREIERRAADREATAGTAPTGEARHAEPVLSPEVAATANAALLAEITSLESENASLRDKLKKAEETLAAAQAQRREASVPLTTDRALREQQKSLDNKLFDMEARYIAAQAEITRLTLQLERYEFDDGEAESASRKDDRIAQLEASNEALRRSIEAKAAATDDFSLLREKLKDVAAELTAGLADEEDLRPLDETLPIAANEDDGSLASRIRLVRSRLSENSDSIAASATKR